MKKIIVLILCLILIFSFSGCGKKEPFEDEVVLFDVTAQDVGASLENGNNSEGVEQSSSQPSDSDSGDSTASGELNRKSALFAKGRIPRCSPFRTESHISNVPIILQFR